MGGVTPLQVLMEWRKHVRLACKAVKNVIPNAEIYVIGGAAENRLTIRSDIDILVVLPCTAPTFNEAIELRSRILEEAVKLGLPLYAPIELHIVGREELKKYVKKGKVIPANKI